ncbi:MAG: DEAD/DEAH box helicase, partial [Thermoplasmata archaeon]|nr:DEAD/DEAH box helicase [Thermoplasmata archaeon]
MHSGFEEYFEEATGFIAYPYQCRLAESRELPSLVHVPTGVGKTEASILAWLWRRRHHEDNDVRKKTPRRLIYCLPMRVLVEQTYKRAEIILKNLGLHEEVGLYILMGGEDKTNWTAHPEAEAILIGTQDMLLSRAMNRGYGASRFRWPVEFGLLNNDCLWVFDEVQLMDAGLATSAQLAAFRGHLGIY